MGPQVVGVEPTDNYKLRILFANGERRVFDVSPYLDKGIFVELRDIDYFRSARVVAGSVEWPNEQDFSFDTLYLAGVAC